jgi:hypothetical protein
MIRLRIGRIPECHHGIPDELVDCSALRQDNVRQAREIARCLLHQYIGIGTFRDRGEPAHVGEENGNLLPGPAKLCRYGIVEYSANDLARS